MVSQTARPGLRCGWLLMTPASNTAIAASSLPNIVADCDCDRAMREIARQSFRTASRRFSVRLMVMACPNSPARA